MKYPKAVRRAVAQQQQAVRQAFLDHNERIRPLLPPSLQRLQEVSKSPAFHDALIRSLRIDAGQRTLRLSLYCCDSSDCFDLDLEYKDIQLTDQETSLLCFIAHEDAEVYRGEIDLEEGAGSPVFIHRILWQTGIQIGREPAEGKWQTRYMLNPEIELRFGGFEIEITPNSENQLSRGDNFITVVRDAEKIG
jgi:hypothetical protein